MNPHQQQDPDSIDANERDSSEEDPDDWQVKARKRARLDSQIEDPIDVEKLDAFDTFQKERAEPVIKGVNFDVINYWFQRFQAARDGAEDKQLSGWVGFGYPDYTSYVNAG